MKIIKNGCFVVCKTNKGRMVEMGGSIAEFETHFDRLSIAEVRDVGPTSPTLYVIGKKAEYIVDNTDFEYIDPTQTGKGPHAKKICNICHVIKPQSAFQPNQHDSTGKITTRPSCKICRRDIDRISMTAAARRKAAKHKPKKGTLWKCPIC
ncbi:Hpy99I family type II restriction endonuclease [Candidatus Spongiihabitans sp.]|uniref:Hpy99I family type II restriction endonuclease n=1 Tax=Candidatus Spongiihabitans sp. TaxID=3101308 RepID=UPI003C6FFCBB